MDKSEGGEFYYLNELVEGSLEWQNASYKLTNSELQSFVESQANINTTRNTTSDLQVF